MTFGIGIKVREGIVALADTRIVKGSEQVSKQKLAVMKSGDDSLFAMTSGLRSVRDKSLIYLEEQLAQAAVQPDRMYQVVNLFGDQLRRVRTEDGQALDSSQLAFNTHAILGGCLRGDASPQLFYVYPEGNWIEAAQDSPYFVIGRTTYGKPLLDRLLNYETSLRFAVALAILAFDATRSSVTDVDCPIDVAVIPNGQRHASTHRYHEREIERVSSWWSETLTNALGAMPLDWMDVLLPPTASSSTSPSNAHAIIFPNPQGFST